MLTVQWVVLHQIAALQLIQSRPHRILKIKRCSSAAEQVQQSVFYFEHVHSYLVQSDTVAHYQSYYITQFKKNFQKKVWGGGKA